MRIETGRKPASLRLIVAAIGIERYACAPLCRCLDHRDAGKIVKGRLARARFLRAIHDHCLERDMDPAVLMTEEADYTVEGGYAAMQRLLQRRQIGHIAVFAANDLMALGAMMAARDAGKECPRDVSILGFDGIPAGAFSWPGLTTIEKPARELGYRATDNLLAEIAGRPPTPRTYLACRLIERGSLADLSEREPLRAIGGVRP